MMSIAEILHRTGQRPGTDLVLKFVEHFAAIKQALDDRGLWDETDGLYYDRLITPSGEQVPLKVRSIVAILPALAMSVVDQETIDLAMVVGKRFAALLAEHGMTSDGLAGPSQLADSGLLRGEPGHQRLLLSLAGPDRLRRLLTVLLDEAEFLSPHGLRALSAWHRDHPYTIDVEGYQASIDYEPAESTTPLFGGNSNWRGPVWFPVNYLVISVLERYEQFFGDELTIEYPTGSGRQLPLRRDRRRPAGPAHLDLHAGAGRPPAVLRRRAAAERRPRLAGQPGVQRVLPRRQRSRPRRLPPDRLDRPDRRHHPPPARRRAVAGCGVGGRFRAGIGSCT